MSGWVVSPAACAAVKKNSAVSRPSRPTASAAMTTTAVEPILIASSSLPRSSAEMVRAVRRIQKIIHVTKPTAMIDSEPPSASCASNVSACWVSASTRVTPTLIATAIPTPSHTLGSTWRRSVRTRNATRMLTTSAASRPSRKPIRKLPSTASP